MKTKVLIVIVLLVAVALIVGRCTYIHEIEPKQKAEREAAQIEAETQEGAEEGPSMDPSQLLTDRQKKLIAAYTSEQKDFMTLIESYIWTSDGGTVVLRVKDNSYSILDDGEVTQEGTIAIVAMSHETVAEHGQTYTQWDAAVECDTGSFMLRLQQASTDQSMMSLYCEGFKPTTYVSTEATNTFDVEGITEDIAGAIDGNDKRLTSELKEYCAVAYPTVTHAICDPAVMKDYSTGLVTLNFYLENTTSTYIAVTYDPETGSFEIGNR